MFKLVLDSLHAIFLLPISAMMAPLCIFSSSLYEWLMSWLTEGEAIIVGTLGIEWIVSVLAILELLINRRDKSIFFN